MKKKLLNIIWNFVWNYLQNSNKFRFFGQDNWFWSKVHDDKQNVLNSEMIAWYIKPVVVIEVFDIQSSLQFPYTVTLDSFLMGVGNVIRKCQNDYHCRIISQKGLTWTNSNRDFYLDVYTIFKSDKINDMDHMRISGTEPSSVFMSQRVSLKSWKVRTKNCLNKLKPKGMV